MIGVPDDRMGEVARAFIVTKAGTRLTPDEVMSWARLNMANYKVPRSVEICDHLPLNASGKVQKNLLRPGSNGRVRRPRTDFTPPY